MTKTVLTYCSECDGDKNHKKLFSKTVKSSSKSTEEFSVVECMGCNSISFLQTIRVSKRSKPMHFNYPDDSGNPGYYIFLSEKHVAIFPKAIKKLYDELIPAYQSGAKILLGMGLRALVEAICIDQSITGSNLVKKIEKLHHEGHISKSELPILDKLRIIGNDSAHKIRSLSIYKLELALGIVNHVLTSIYILPVINKKLEV
jgi:hypothetical protein